jgi:hypothetical protein
MKLLAGHCNSDLQDKRGRTALQVAQLEGHAGIAKLIQTEDREQATIKLIIRTDDRVQAMIKNREQAMIKQVASALQGSKQAVSAAQDLDWDKTVSALLSAWVTMR